MRNLVATRLQALIDDLDRLARIRAVIAEYHYALDRRHHGDIAAGLALSEIQAILGAPWVQGAEKARREQQAGGTD